MNLTQKIIGSHLVSGTMTPGSEIGLRIDQTLTQDATGTMAWLQFEALGIPRVKTDISLSYVDHNTLQMNFRNPDDHRFLRTVAAKFGGVYSGPGTGICHQLHLENFAKPGATLVGSDSHTPTAGGICSLAMGAGGLSVALAMAGEPYYIPMPKVVRVFLTGALTGWASAKDVILELLRRRTVKGGVGRRPGGPPGGGSPNGLHPPPAPPPPLNGGGGPRVLIRRARRRHPFRAGTRHHRQHGRGTRRHGHSLPLRRRDPRLPQGHGPRSRLAGARPRRRRRV